MPAIADVKVSQALHDWVEIFMRRSAQEMQASFRQTGLGFSQVGSLFRLHFRGPCPVSDLGHSLDVTTAAASHLVERLVQMGLLRRYEDSADRRIRRVSVTEKGEKVVGQMIEARHQWMARLTSALTPEEHDEVVRALGYLTRAAQEVESAERDALSRR